MINVCIADLYQKLGTQEGNKKHMLAQVKEKEGQDLKQFKRNKNDNQQVQRCNFEIWIVV